MADIDFIQIGANIGNTASDPLWPIVRERGWKGIFVEPIAQSFEQLVENYKDVDGCFFENVAIHAYDGEVTMYNSSEGHDHRQQASVVRGYFPKVNNQEVQVKCITLASLIEKYDLLGKEFEILQLDVERSEQTILLNTDFTDILPRVIRFEHIHIRRGDKDQSIVNHLAKFGYERVSDEYDVEGQGYDTMMERNPPYSRTRNRKVNR